MPTITINKIKLQLDVMDADDNEKLNTAKNEVFAAINTAAEKDAPTAEKIRGVCEAIRKFFDACFGDGLGAQVCGTRDNFNVCQNAFLEVVEAIKKQTDDYNQKIRASAAQLQARFSTSAAGK